MTLPCWLTNLTLSRFPFCCGCCCCCCGLVWTLPTKFDAIVDECSSRNLLNAAFIRSSSSCSECINASCCLSSKLRFMVETIEFWDSVMPRFGRGGITGGIAAALLDVVVVCRCCAGHGGLLVTIVVGGEGRESDRGFMVDEGLGGRAGGGLESLSSGHAE